jgi:hypothetical protein
VASLAVIAAFHGDKKCDKQGCKLQLFLHNSPMLSHLNSFLFSTAVRWDEKAGLRAGCGVRSQPWSMLDG